MKKKNVVLSLSGGLDSSTLLLRCLDEYENITCLSFDYGQKHKIEIEKARELVEYLNDNPYRTWWKDRNVLTTYPKITHKVIKLDGLSSLLVSGLVDNDSMEMKKGHYAHENALTTVVPNRNAIFASITYAVALSMVKKNNFPCDIALGTHMGDFDNNKKEGIYPDCSEEFRIALEYAFKIGNWDSEKVNYYAPYNITDKPGVLKDGLKLCKKLKLDYKEVYKRTMTSYSPVKKGNESFSDYKTGSSIERIVSFIEAGKKDPITYVEDDGTPVTWKYVKEYALKLEEEFKRNHK
jgi:7-cyano-7-deazaguanine synthase